MITVRDLKFGGPRNSRVGGRFVNVSADLEPLTSGAGAGGRRLQEFQSSKVEKTPRRRCQDTEREWKDKLT